MKRQRGLTLTGMILVSIIIVLTLLLGFKVVPVYTEYFATERALKAMSIDPKLRNPSRSAIAGAWAARASVDDLRALQHEQIDFVREGDQIVFTAEYSVKVPLFRNISACFDFKPDSR